MPEYDRRQGFEAHMKATFLVDRGDGIWLRVEGRILAVYGDGHSVVNTPAKDDPNVPPLAARQCLKNMNGFTADGMPTVYSCIYAFDHAGACCAFPSEPYGHLTGKRR